MGGASATRRPIFGLGARRPAQCSALGKKAPTNSPARQAMGDADDAERRAEELQALRSIYGGEDEVVEVGPSEWRLRLALSERLVCTLEVHLPETYPSRVPPTPVLHARGVDDATLARLADELVGMFDGEAVVFVWAEHLREALGAMAESPDGAGVGAGAGADDGGSASARDFDGDCADDELAVDILHGEPFTPPGKSTFQAHAAEITSVAQVGWMLRTLLAERKIARATHNMYAYRLWDGSRGVQLADNDDDGEHGAGGRLAALLEMMDVGTGENSRGACVVVTRWYGGIHLGPDRFKHISNAARELIEAAGFAGRRRAAKPAQRRAKG